jgi:ribosome maturation factor RimP
MNGPGTDRPARPTAGAVDPLLLGLVSDCVAAAELYLEDIQVRRHSGREVLRVLLDSDSGVTMDEVAAASAAISTALDASGAMGQRPYVLDVGSPGVERPLVLLRHFRRNIGRLVRIRQTSGKVLQGRIVDAEGPGAGAPPTTVTIDREGQQLRLPVSVIAQAVVQVEFTDAGPQEG